eukprot:GEMP01124134.1.p1 GENE.GEMP01124134.1~~GEMP01124134.1.p1  ORF type:complete len:100 (+),score=0.36 GEMP01124134.1:249-548(+)
MFIRNFEIYHEKPKVISQKCHRNTFAAKLQNNAKYNSLNDATYCKIHATYGDKKKRFCSKRATGFQQIFKYMRKRFFVCLRVRINTQKQLNFDDRVESI